MGRKRRKRRGARFLTVFAVVFCLTAIFLVVAFSKVFKVRDIMVVGNRHLLSEEVITQSGIEVGDNVLTVLRSDLRKRMEENRYIEYLGCDFNYRGTLTLHINERLGVGVVKLSGWNFVVDASGVVLENVGEAYLGEVPIPQIGGFVFEANAMIEKGKKLPVRSSEQLEAMKTIVKTLDQVNLFSRAAMIGVAKTDELYVMTTDGTQIVLGDKENMMTKLLIAKQVLTLREQSGRLQGARIDVSSGRDAHYIPDVLPTITPVPTPTPTPEPSATPAL